VSEHHPSFSQKDVSGQGQTKKKKTQEAHGTTVYNKDPLLI
jgi:hypothetical protein